MLSDHEVRTMRWRAQGLQPDAVGRDVAGVVRRVGAIQAQDPRASELAIRARSTGLSAGDVEHARVTERSVVRTWCQRGTIHLVPAEDAAWMTRLLAPDVLKARQRNFQRLGLDEHTLGQARTCLRAALADGPLTKEEIGQAWDAAGIDASGSRLTHLITHIALLGDLCDGPDRGSKRTWVRLADWVETDEGPQNDTALAELARRFLRGHGPAGPLDFATWSGLPVSAARTGWELIASGTEQIDTPQGPQLALRGADATPPAVTDPVIRLLGAFDAYLLGYRDRAFSVPEPHTKKVSGGGLRVLPAIAVDGVVTGTWKLHRKARRAEIELQPFDEAGGHDVSGEAADIGRFLCVPVAVR